MKKTIAVIVALCMVLSGTAAFAEAKGQSEPAEGTPVKTQEMKRLSEQLRPQVDEIRVNRAEIQMLREEIRIAHSDAKDAVREMIQNKDELGLERVKELRASMEKIRESRSVIAETVGKISDEMPMLRSRVRNRNQEGASESLGNCINVQTIRMQEMNRVLGELKGIVETEVI
jgi:uncharacterized coiled-coil DUF342 family protein